jgi:hypothetical protein
MTASERLRSARAAARAYCLMHGYGDQGALERDPVLGPVTLTRDGRTVTAYRWLGSGRGADYVQVEIDLENGEITVSGARGDHGFPSWQAKAGGSQK